jgi:hypothetical protein
MRPYSRSCHSYEHEPSRGASRCALTVDLASHGRCQPASEGSNWIARLRFCVARSYSPILPYSTPRL